LTTTGERSGTEQRKKNKGKKEERERSGTEDKIIKNRNGKWQMNSARHLCLATIAKTYFSSREACPLGGLFCGCGLYLSLFYLLARRLGML
jgi:hypothetical protein